MLLHSANQRTPELSGRVTIVTGAAHGVGRGIAKEFAEHRASVVVADRNALGAQEVAHEITTIGGTALAVPFDLAKAADCERLVETVLQQYGRIDVLINNASTWSDKPFIHSDATLESNWGDLEDVIHVNLIGTMYLSRAAAREMAKNSVVEDQCNGAIIQITSIHERVVRLHHSEYPVSKAGQGMLVRELAIQLAPYRIRVNGIAPGMIALETSKVDAGARLPSAYVPFRHSSGLPVEIGRMAVVLASDYWSGYVTGTTIEVSGGLHLYNHWVHELQPGSGKVSRLSEGQQAV